MQSSNSIGAVVIFEVVDYLLVQRASRARESQVWPHRRSAGAGRPGEDSHRLREGAVYPMGILIITPDFFLRWMLTGVGRSVPDDTEAGISRARNGRSASLSSCPKFECAKLSSATKTFQPRGYCVRCPAFGKPPSPRPSAASLNPANRPDRSPQTPSSSTTARKFFRFVLPGGSGGRKKVRLHGLNDHIHSVQEATVATTP